MTSRAISGTLKQAGLTATQWLCISLHAAVSVILAVLVVQAVILVAGALLVSFIPDNVLPVPGRTLTSSSAAVFLHLVAGLVMVRFLGAGYRRALRLHQGW